MKKVPVIMLQPMGGVNVNYTTGQEVLVTEDVAEAWEKADIAKPKAGTASKDAVTHPDPVESHDARAEREASEKADAEAAEAKAKEEAEAKAKADTEAAEAKAKEEAEAKAKADTEAAK